MMFTNGIQRTFDTKMYHQEPEKTKLYLFSYLGKGTTSKVYRAISESGHGCVVKLYVQNRDNGNKEMEEDEFIEFSTALALKEENNFKEIYPELSEYVRRGQLNKLQCSMMPFFDPITMNKRTSNAVIMGIRQQLQRFGEKRKDVSTIQSGVERCGIFPRSNLFIRFWVS